MLALPGNVLAVSALNAAPIGPATEVTWLGPAAETIPTGKVLVTATISGHGTIDTAVTAQLVRDATNPTGAPGGTAIGAAPVAETGHVGGDFSISLSWVDTVTPGSSHSYAVTASAGSALTLDANRTQVTVVPLSG